MNDVKTMGLVERLRNGGQSDLADMAEGLVLALNDCANALDYMGDCSDGEVAPRVWLHTKAEARITNARAALAVADGEPHE